MKNKKIIITAIVIVLLFLLWLFSSKGGNSVTEGGEIKGTLGHQGVPAAAKYPVLESAIRPIDVVDLEAVNAAEMSLSNEDNAQVLKKFQLGVDAALSEDWSTAVNEFERLIKEYPSVVEPYINLSAVYAKTNQLEKSRETLLMGINANSNYQVLFESLQTIHGELAAQAYRVALTEGASLTDNAQINLNLPIVNALNMQAVKPPSSQGSTSISNDELITSRERVDELESNLFVATEKIKKLEEKLGSNNPVDILADDPSEMLIEAQERIALLESKFNTTVKRYKQQEVEFGKKIATLELQLESKETTGYQPAIVDNNIIDVEKTVSNKSVGAELVERWAGFWSAQDVNNYIDSYEDGYRPQGSGLSHQQWREQRQVRLTNKAYIKVSVQNFIVEEHGGLLKVSFSQNYKSNTVDDTIRKQLIFSKSGQSWRDAKIINETVINN